MGKKMKKKSGKVLILEIIVFLAAIFFVYINRSVLFPKKPVPPVPALNPVIKLYQSSDIFSQIELKKQLIDPNLKVDIYQNNDFIHSVKENYFPYNARLVMDIPQDQLVAMKCLPEQIYLERKGKYAILPSGATVFESFTPKDHELLKLVDILKSQAKTGYTLAQFIACKSEDGRYIVKYNVIATERAAYGYANSTNPTAFFTQISGDWQIRDVSYISSDGAYCRYPIELTKSNLLYFECDMYGWTRTSTGARVTHADIYRIDLNEGKYSKIASCGYSITGVYCQN